MDDVEAGSSVELRDALHAAATHVLEAARRRDGVITWPTPVASPDPAGRGGWVWRATADAPPTLYDGLAGIARGLALAAPVVGERAPAVATEMRVTAAAAIASALTSAEQAEPALRPGLYDGAMGIACVAVELGCLWRDGRLVRRGRAVGARAATEAAGRLEQTADGDWLPDHHETAADALDLVSGAAGIACGAAWIEAWSGVPLEMDTSAVLARVLAGQPPAILEPGLAHGASGVVVGRAHLWRQRPDSAPSPMTAYDDAVSTAGSGPLASPSDDDLTWCRGLVGICLARQRVAALIGRQDAGALRLRDVVLSAAAARAVAPEDWSLCHGRGGVTALLLSGVAPASAADDLRLARRWLVEGARGALRTGLWPGGAPMAVPQHGLMTGEAGVLLLLSRALRPGARWPIWV